MAEVNLDYPQTNVKDTKRSNETNEASSNPFPFELDLFFADNSMTRHPLFT